MDKAEKAVSEPRIGILEHHVATDPFGNNIHGERAYRRLERIVAAIFLLTTHVHDPIQAEVRSRAMSALRQMLSLRSTMRDASPEGLGELMATLRNIISLTRLLVVGGYVSIQNGQVITAAIDEFSAYLTALGRSPLSDAHRLSKDDFSVGAETYKGHIKDIRDKQIKKDINDNQSDRAILPLRDRATAIVGILQGNRALSIKEIAIHVPEYGEKTVQRELAALISAGAVKRIGLKRWSKYLLGDSGKLHRTEGGMKDTVA